MTVEKINEYFNEFTSFSEQVKLDVIEQLETEQKKNNEKKKQAESNTKK